LIFFELSCIIWYNNQDIPLWDSITVMQRPVKSYYAGAEPAPTAYKILIMDKYISKICKHNVSDNAVRKWAKQYNIDTNRKNL